MKYEKELKEIVKSDKQLMEILRSVKSLNLNNWCVGAGIVRDLVWSRLHNLTDYSFKDIDVAYHNFDEDISLQYIHENHLARLKPEFEWDVKNQANVHMWYSKKFGLEIEPLLSINESISIWPETATCVGVYLDCQDNVQLIAPYGLNDLFDIVLRRNPKIVTIKEFERRIESKDIINKWSKITIIRE